MASTEELRTLLRRLDGRGYRAYRELEGAWSLARGVELSIDHVQGDPFAAPSRVSLHLRRSVAALPADLLESDARRVGVAAHLARAFARAAGASPDRRGSGGSGLVRMEDPGQVVTTQTAVQVTPEGLVEARFTAGLPARARRVLGSEAERLLLVEIPALARASLMARAHDPAALRASAEVAEDFRALQDALAPRGLVAFVGDGAVLPRRSGVDDRPLEGEGVVPFATPPELEVTIDTPHAGSLRGMGIPRGITLVVGGGFHGKSTLLRALESGVVGHAPGDGRERVASDPDTVKIRAEDGRAVAGVDISPFVGRLPGGMPTTAFSTADASGSTSQAAALVEAIESGARVILVDEDTAATNVMIRDRRMQELVPAEGEPITPLVDRIRELHESLGLSAVLVVGGSGDWLDVADTVLRMDAYRARDVSARAREVARRHPTGRQRQAGGPLRRPARIPLPDSVDASRGRRRVHLKVRAPDEILFGAHAVDLSGVEQLISRAQARAVGEALVLARERFMDGRRTLAAILDEVMALIASEGLDALDDRRPGDLAAFRRHELAAALNRLRTLRVERPRGGGS
jgi:predicted ABC-class ATPase